jgi:hypothetical protein
MALKDAFTRHTHELHIRCALPLLVRTVVRSSY